MLFRVFIFIFCLETTVRENKSDFARYYSNFFFKSVISNILGDSFEYTFEYTSSAITKHLGNGIWRF